MRVRQIFLLTSVLRSWWEATQIAVLPLTKFLWNKSDCGIKHVLVVIQMLNASKKSKGISIFIFTFCHFCLVKELQWPQHPPAPLAGLNWTLSADLAMAFSSYTIFKVLFLKTPSKRLIQCKFQCFFTENIYSNMYVEVPQSFPDQIRQSIKKPQTLTYPPRSNIIPELDLGKQVLRSM